MYKQDLELNNLHGIICQEIQPTMFKRENTTLVYKKYTYISLKR